uniref:Uncharacterized protein n=1 Tax=Glossina austeni TaxID=7395 RepID=A0A1A9V775_GLOAU
MATPTKVRVLYAIVKRDIVPWKRSTSLVRTSCESTRHKKDRISRRHHYQVKGGAEDGCIHGPRGKIREMEKMMEVLVLKNLIYKIVISSDAMCELPNINETCSYSTGTYADISHRSTYKGMRKQLEKQILGGEGIFPSPYPQFQQIMNPFELESVFARHSLQGSWPPQEKRTIEFGSAGETIIAIQRLNSSRDVYSWQIFKAKCNELQYICGIISEKIKRRLEILYKNREPMERAEKPNEWCAHGIELSTLQRIEKCSRCAELVKQRLQETQTFKA